MSKMVEVKVEIETELYEAVKKWCEERGLTVEELVQQDSYAALNPVKTIGESLCAAVRCADKKARHKEITDKVYELMTQIGLIPVDQYYSKYPHNLSGGQRQRVLLARAIAFNPKIIVADEPISMIDVSLRVSILNLMNQLNVKYGISFVYITHDLSTAKYIARNGRLCVMYLGEIVEEGNIEEILANSRHPYTQALIKAVPDLFNNYYGELPLKSMELTGLEDRGDGCTFANRCPYAMPQCEVCVSEKDYGSVKIKCNL